MGRRCGPALCTLWRSTRYWIVFIRRSGNSTAASMQSSRYRHKWSYDRRLSSAVVLYGLEMESEELKFLRDQGMFYVYDFGVSPNQLTALDKHWQVTTTTTHSHNQYHVCLWTDELSGVQRMSVFTDRAPVDWAHDLFGPDDWAQPVSRLGPASWSVGPTLGRFGPPPVHGELQVQVQAIPGV